MTVGGGEPETLGEISRRITRQEEQFGRELRDLRGTCAKQASDSVQQAVYAVHRETDRQDLAEARAELSAVKASIEALKQANNDRTAQENARYRRVLATAVTGLAFPIIVGLFFFLLRGGA